MKETTLPPEADRLSNTDVYRLLHDLRGPSTQLVHLTILLQEDLQGHDNEDVQVQLRYLLEAARQMKSRVDRFAEEAEAKPAIGHRDALN